MEKGIVLSQSFSCTLLSIFEPNNVLFEWFYWKNSGCLLFNFYFWNWNPLMNFSYNWYSIFKVQNLFQCCTNWCQYKRFRTTCGVSSKISTIYLYRSITPYKFITFSISIFLQGSWNKLDLKTPSLKSTLNGRYIILLMWACTVYAHCDVHIINHVLIRHFLMRAGLNIAISWCIHVRSCTNSHACIVIWLYDAASCDLFPESRNPISGFFAVLGVWELSITAPKVKLEFWDSERK